MWTRKILFRWKVGCCSPYQNRGDHNTCSEARKYPQASLPYKLSRIAGTLKTIGYQITTDTKVNDNAERVNTMPPKVRRPSSTAI